MDHNISLDGYNLDNEFPVFMKMCHHSFCLLRVLKNHDDSPHNSNHDLTVKIKTFLISQLREPFKNYLADFVRYKWVQDTGYKLSSTIFCCL